MQKLVVGLVEDVEGNVKDYLKEGWVVVHLKLSSGSERVARKSNTIIAIVLQKGEK